VALWQPGDPPQPWSHSRLKDFKNCPRAFFEKQVAKSVVEDKGEATIWGERVHKSFEDRLNDGVVLPPELAVHEPAIRWVEQLPGQMYVEERIALNLRGQPCGYWDDDVWYRGVVDVMKIDGTEAWLRDWKTGKTHNDFDQLKLFAIHTFAAHPEVQTCKVEYYWTQTHSRSTHVYPRTHIPALWKPFVGDLRQYAEAYKTNTWQPRQSGLCRGWCPVTDCEFWQPKRLKG
jgi:hypothetical protein